MTNFQSSCAWPPADGIKIYIYKVGPDGQRDFVGNVVDPTIQSCQLKAKVNVTDLLGSGTYEAHVVIFSAAGVHDDHGEACRSQGARHRTLQAPGGF